MMKMIDQSDHYILYSIWDMGGWLVMGVWILVILKTIQLFFGGKR